MYGDDIRLSENFISRDDRRAHLSRAVNCKILTPGDHLHTEGVANLCHCTADVAETQHTERPPGNVITDGLLPSAATQRRVLGDEIAGTAQNKCPGQFDRRRRGVARMNDLDAALFCGLKIDRGIPFAVEAIMRSLGKRSMMLRVIGVRSRITQTMSNGCRRSTTASESARWSLNTVTVARPSSADQSASERATFW